MKPTRKRKASAAAVEPTDALDKYKHSHEMSPAAVVPTVSGVLASDGTSTAAASRSTSQQ